MAHFRRPETMPDDEIGGPVARGRWFVSGASTPERQALERAAYRELTSQFDIVSVLQRSAAAVLYDARDIENDRRVALRIVSRKVLADAGLEEPLIRALSGAASMDHPNIVAIQRSGVAARVLWYAMEYVEGPSLAALLRDRGPIDFRRCMSVVEQAAAALQYAHRREVVHGDIHPANIFLFGPGWVLISDFAVGRVLASLPAGKDGWADRHRPVYRAPEEEATELPPSPSADQYALALTIWESLTGAPPGAQHEDQSLAARLMEQRPDLPPHVGTALARALRARPSERFATVQDLVAAMAAAGPAPITVAPPRTSEPSALNQRLLFVRHPQRKRSWRAIAGPIAVIGALAMAVYSFRPWSVAETFAPAVPVLRPETPAAPPPSPTPQAVIPPTEPEPTRELASDNPVIPDSATRQPESAAGSREVPARASNGGDRSEAPAAGPSTGDRSESSRSRQPQRNRAPVRSGTSGRSQSVLPRTTPVPEPAPDSSAILGRLYVSSRPWGQLYVDGRLIGNTPLASVAVSPGIHVIRVVRSGFQSVEREIQITAGQDLRLVDLVLEAVPR